MDDQRVRAAVTGRRALLAGAAAAVVAGCASSDSSPSPSLSPSPSRAAPTTAEVIVAGLATPWSIAWQADGSALVSERDSARVWSISRVGERWQKAAAGTVPGVAHGGEGGLLGLLAHPTQPGHVYAYRTTEGGNRVDLFQTGGGLWRQVETIVEQIPRAGIHNGGRIALSPQGQLVIATGDAGRGERAQDLTSLAGKILRVDLTGTPVPGNPDPRSPVLSYGHRNVQGLAWSADGRLWASEFGPQVDDELNLIEAGKNYGWPAVTGRQSASGSVRSVHHWPSTADASPSAIAIAGEVCWVACLRGSRVLRLQLPRPGQEFDSEFVPSTTVIEGVRYRDVSLTPDGRHLWVLTNEAENSRLLQLPAN